MDPGTRMVSGPATRVPERPYPWPRQLRIRTPQGPLWRPSPGPLLPLLLCLAASAHGSVPSTFQYERPVISPGTGEACADLDPTIFPHAAPALRDLRLFSAERTPVELPYVLTVSEAQQTDSDTARIGNLRRDGDTIDFDLAMPRRPYTEVLLDLDAQNFLASAEVTGLSSTPGAGPIPLGRFTLFDLTAQHLSRNTTLALQESTFPLLHVRLRLHPSSPGQAAPHLSPQIIRSATVPPSREQQVLFETALTAHPQLLGRTTIAHFALPQHLPIERILFRLAPGFSGNFLRTVNITAQSTGSDAQETIVGTIARIHRDIAGMELRQQQMSLNGPIGANLQGPAELTVILDNGPEAPLPLTAIELQVRQRKLCFTTHGEPLTLAYGDPDLRAPPRTSTQVFSPAAHAAVARIGSEAVNPQWRGRPEMPKYRRRQPHLVWVLLLGLAILFGVVAVRASRIVSH